MDAKKLPLPRFGVDMISDQTSLPKGTVKTALNVDIGRTGEFSRRQGYAPVVAGSGFHSIYHAAQKGWVLVCQDNILYRMNTGTYALTSLATLNSTDPVSYTEFNGDIYYTNRTTFGWVPSDSISARVAGIRTPSAPELTLTTVGGLIPGSYGVAITLTDDRGEESGASPVRVGSLAVNGGIILSGLPVVANHRVNVYLTTTDGDQLFWMTDFAAVYSEFIISGLPQGAELSTQFLEPLPPGDFVRGYNGRVYTARLNRLAFSQPMRPRFYAPRHDWIAMSGYISFVEPVKDGLYVGDSRGVWFLKGGDPKTFEPRLVTTERAVRNSSLIMPSSHLPEKAQADELAAVWLSTSGYVAGMVGGQIAPLQADRIRVTRGLTGRSAFLLKEGRKQVATLVNSTAVTAPGVAPDYVLAAGADVPPDETGTGWNGMLATLGGW